MYTIYCEANKYRCEVRIQDGTERWEKPGLEEAVKSVIQAARIMNGTYITQKDIEIIYVPKSTPIVSEEDFKLLQDIKRGAKIVLDYGDPRIRMNISEEDCDLIVRIREGDVRVV